MNQSMIKTISERKSWRTYNDKVVVDQAAIDALVEFIQANNKGYFGTKVRFGIINTSQADRDELRHLGTYGYIKGAVLFLCAVAEKSDKMYEDIGYTMEKNILFASELGFGTCWLGATFDKSGFSKKMEVKDAETLIAVSPLGYAIPKRRFKEHAIRQVLKADSRKDFSKLFFDSSFDKPLVKGDDDYSKMLECVRLGPSASNKQPWRVIKQETKLHLYLERDKTYKYPMGQNIDMGIAMCHIELAAIELGISGSWQISNPGIEKGELEYVVSWE
jgi:hypothetical protein